ncbi:g7584 [Coccomyxa viridis]|uniref:G7584 protein n=1 Tax=Coccomyxa viridis TaxID=1274662 RepID=A0ABP1G4S4_9CHLO
MAPAVAFDGSPWVAAGQIGGLVFGGMGAVVFGGWALAKAAQSGSLAASFQGTGYNPPRRRPIYRIDNVALKAERAARRPRIPDTAQVDESLPPADK